MNFDISSNLQKFLEKTFQDWGGVDTLSEPDCQAALSGGLALRCPARDVLIEPNCCGELGDANNWRVIADYRGADWKMLWIGHPWLTVRFQAPCLIFSKPHESKDPSDCWTVLPEELNRAVEDAKQEIERFAGELAIVLPRLGYQDDPVVMGRRLAGLNESINRF